MLDLYVRLKELGHPDYLQSRDTRTLHCSIQKTAADEVVCAWCWVEALTVCLYLYGLSPQVKITENELMTWMQTVTELRSKYNWLLFFSIPKLLIIYGLLKSAESKEQIEQLMQEISFLCCNDQRTREIVETRMKV